MQCEGKEQEGEVVKKQRRQGLLKRRKNVGQLVKKGLLTEKSLKRIKRENGRGEGRGGGERAIEGQELRSECERTKWAEWAEMEKEKRWMPNGQTDFDKQIIVGYSNVNNNPV